VLIPQRRHLLSPWFWLGGGLATLLFLPTWSGSRRRLEQLFDEIVDADTVVSPYAIAFETNLPVFVRRRPRQPLGEAWPMLERDL
jgi:hypothetical protein